MPRLTYWVAPNLGERSKCYHLRAKTRKALVARVRADDPHGQVYGRPRKVSITYADTLDLINSFACGVPDEGYE